MSPVQSRRSPGAQGQARVALDGPAPRQDGLRDTPEPRRRSWIQWTGRALLVAGLLGALYGVYELFVTDLVADRERTQIAAAWRAEQPPAPRGVGTGRRVSPERQVGTERLVGTEHRGQFPVVDGTGTLGLLHVPRWDDGGDRYEVPIGTGSGDDVLDSGQLGHYSETQPIGAIGNAGLAGHRTTHGKPLREVHRLEDGDAIVVESEDAWLVYRVVARDIVKPHQTEVLDPIPPFRGAEQGRYLTLTTCDPIYGITDRYIVWAEADYWTPKSQGLPPALAGSPAAG